jgi:uncharacterized protein (TIRG00374 family)
MRWKLALVFLVTVACLLWVLWGMKLEDLSLSLKHFQPLWILPALLLLTSNMFVRNLRFRLLLETEQPLPFFSLLSIVTVGFLAINVIPLRMGELVRPYLLHESHDVPFGTSLAAVVLERLLDFLGMLTLLLLIGAFVQLPSAGLVVQGIDIFSLGLRLSAFFVAAGLVGIVLFSWMGERSVQWMAGLFARISPALSGVISSLGLKFVHGLRALFARPSRALWALVCTFLIWSSTLLMVACMMWGFKGMTPTFSSVIFNWGATMVGIVFLPTPGFFGGFEAGNVASLLLFKVPLALARTYALVLHLVVFFHAVAAGLFFLMMEGWSLVSLVKNSQQTLESESSEKLPASSESQ